MFAKCFFPQLNCCKCITSSLLVLLTNVSDSSVFGCSCTIVHTSACAMRLLFDAYMHLQRIHIDLFHILFWFATKNSIVSFSLSVCVSLSFSFFLYIISWIVLRELKKKKQTTQWKTTRMLLVSVEFWKIGARHASKQSANAQKFWEKRWTIGQFIEIPIDGCR